MKNFKQFMLSESRNQFDDAAEWLATLDLNKRTPNGMKKEMGLLQFAWKQIENWKQFNGGEGPPQMVQDNVLRVIDDVKLKKELIDLKLGKSAAQPNIVKGKYATYHKEDKSAYKKFQEAIKNLETFLATLSGYHKKAIGKDLNIVFTSSMKSIAKYRRQEDVIWVNARRAGNTLEKYGSLRYIVLHELGHRYLAKNRQTWNIDGLEWATTKYSFVDSMTGEEKFAELFAITNWESQYKPHADKMDKFKKIIH